MHILFIANCEVLYGANRSMIDLAVGLQNLGQDIYFFIPYQGTMESRHILRMKLEEYGFAYAFMRYVPSVHLSCEKGMAEKMLRREINAQCQIKMKAYIAKWEIDIIHTNSLTHMIGASLSKQTHKPHVWHVREALKNHYDFHYDSVVSYRHALRNAGKIICISEYVRKTHRKMLRDASVIVLRDGFCVDKYVLDGVYNKCQTEYRMLICGVIYEGKGQLEAVKAVDSLLNRYNMRNIHLQIVGDGSGDYYNKIKDYIQEKDLYDYVEMLPFQEDLREIRKNTDIALMCSKSEALGRVTVESMLSENLVIGADSGGTAEIIKDGVNGHLYKCGDAKDLCGKIYYAITHWNEQERIIANAKEYAIANYDISLYAKRMMGIYKSVL